VARAAAAATGEVRLGGEVRRVAALFVDLVGSTTLATQRPPGEVVGLLNRLFGVVVEVVEEHGGWVNKFEGDAALAVFGAPVGVPDPAGSALAAGRPWLRGWPPSCRKSQRGSGSPRATPWPGTWMTSATTSTP